MSQDLYAQVPAVQTSNPSGSASGKKYMPDQEWERIREPFTWLFKVQRRPLKEIMQILEDDYAFQATNGMYNYRIQKWGLRRNCNVAEKDQYRSIAQQCQRSGRSLPVYDQNRNPIPWRQVQRHIGWREWHRLGLPRIPEACSRSMSPSTLTADSNSPDTENENMYSQHSLLSWHRSAATLDTTSSILRCIAAYHSWYNLTRQVDCPEADTLPLRDYGYLRFCFHADNAHASNQNVTPFRIIARAMLRPSKWLVGEILRLFFESYSCPNLFSRYKVLMFLRCATKVFLGDSNPIASMIGVLRDLLSKGMETDRWNMNGSISRAAIWGCLLGEIGMSLPHQLLRGHGCREFTIVQIEALQEEGHCASAIVKVQDLVADTEATCGINHPDRLRSQMLSAYIRYCDNDFTGALAILDPLLIRWYEHSSHPSFVGMCSALEYREPHCLLIDCYKSLGNPERSNAEVRDVFDKLIIKLTKRFAQKFSLAADV